MNEKLVCHSHLMASLSADDYLLYTDLYLCVLQGATWLYESVVSPTLKQLGAEARKVPALQKALDKLDAFTVSFATLSIVS